VAGHSEAWDQAFREEQDEKEGPRSEELLASLDTAILALVERLECEPSELPKLLDDILQDSLWTRTLARRSDQERAIQRTLLHQRAAFLWLNSTEVQRRGYFAAGVGYRTGKRLDDNAEELNLLLLRAEQAIEERDSDSTVEAVAEFARIVFDIAPFTPKELPDQWEQVLRNWITGKPMADIVSADPEGLVELVEDAIVYRLVWAVEAVRARSRSHQDEYADLWSGRLAGALEAGTMDRCAVILIHAGLGSRVAALAALSDFPGDFKDYQGMKDWLRSEPLVEAGRVTDWPTPDTADLWRSFVTLTYGDSTRAWSVQSKHVSVNWKPGVGALEGDFVRVLRQTTKTEICTADFSPIGELKQIVPNLTGVLFGKVAHDVSQLELIYHGPGTLR